MSPLHRVYLSLGSNLGQRQENLSTALQRLRAIVNIETISSIYETEPVGYRDQPHFLNLVCSGQTTSHPETLLQSIKAIEEAMGRQPSFRNAPRLIDIDVLLYEDMVLETEHLIIPHPRMSERAFVLVPLAEIAPDVIHPSNGKTAKDLLLTTSQEGIQKFHPAGENA